MGGAIKTTIHMKRKVYCKNCRWFNEYEECRVVSPRNPYFSKKYMNTKGGFSFKWRNKEEYIKSCKEYKIGVCNNKPPQTLECCNFNEHYNCKYYKRRWWKFWIR